ncbi:MAG TPA: sulfatase-like hydrolase/transferase, partial [Opitutus sp.]|nr:sulfatase-like hydrolase/transferase [Opitutus sp.]
MKKHSFVLGAVALAFSLVAPVSVSAGAPPPNVVIIVADDLGVTDLSVLGKRDVLTPHIDSIAQQGTSFTQ